MTDFCQEDLPCPQWRCALIQLERPALALQRGLPAALNASCARRALLPIAQVVQKSNPDLEPAENLANVG